MHPRFLGVSRTSALQPHATKFIRVFLTPQGPKDANPVAKIFEVHHQLPLLEEGSVSLQVTLTMARQRSTGSNCLSAEGWRAWAQQGEKPPQMNAVTGVGGWVGC